MAERDRPHIFIQGRGVPERYTRPPRNIGGYTPPAPSDRRQHGMGLAAQLRLAEANARGQRDELPADLSPAAGIYVTFESFPDVELAFESLDPRRGRVHPELVAVRSVETPSGIQQRATVFVPDGKLGYFLRRLNDYAITAAADQGKNRNLVDRIASISLSSLEQLWTDAPEDFPDPNELTWWELWLRRTDGQERDRVETFADGVGARVGRLTLGFPDRIVVLLEATAEQLAAALGVLDDLAELRRPQQPAALLALEPPAEQAEWVAELAERVEAAPEDAPAACVLDTGTYAEHPLLEPSLEAADRHACDPAWTDRDHDGHGTEMAGLADRKSSLRLPRPPR